MKKAMISVILLLHVLTVVSCFISKVVKPNSDLSTATEHNEVRMRRMAYDNTESPAKESLGKEDAYLEPVYGEYTMGTRSCIVILKPQFCKILSL